MLEKYNPITLAIVDDHPVVIEGVRILLKDEPGIAAVESFTEGGAFMAYLAEHTVNLVLLDIMLPDINGIDLCKEIKKTNPGTIVLALSNQAERSIIFQVLQHGASGYLLKNASAGELKRCIAEALSGELAFSREVKEIITHPSLQELKTLPAITRREKQVLQFIAAGKTTNMIAAELSVSPLTIETHRRNLLQKFGAKNVAELLMAAVQQKLL